MSIVASNNVTEPSAKQKELATLFTQRPDAIHIAPEGWCFPAPFLELANDIKEFSFEENDTIVMTAPKSGTTWTLDIVWTMKNNPDFNHPSAHLHLNTRCPHLELDMFFTTREERDAYFGRISEENLDQECDNCLEAVRKHPRPRTIKTHLPLQLLSDTALSKAKVVYVIRDPRDVCVSFYHHCKIFKAAYFEGTFDQFVDAFLEGAVVYCPYWPHVRAAWERRDHPNLHVMFYEHIKKHPKAELQKLSEFLGLEIAEAQMEKIVEHTSFEAMKKRDQHVVNPEDTSSSMNMDVVGEKGGFFRQGTSGGWKQVLTQEQKDKFDTWIEENCPDKEIMNMILNP